MDKFSDPNSKTFRYSFYQVAHIVYRIDRKLDKDSYEATILESSFEAYSLAQTFTVYINSAFARNSAPAVPIHFPGVNSDQARIW
jgi:hypothetical protein